MKKLFGILLALSLIAGLVIIIGCSDDDEPTKPIVKDTGDPDAPEFEAARMAIGFTGGMNGEMLGFMFEVVGFVLDHPDFPIPAKYDIPWFGAGIMADSFYLAYHEDSKYWYAFFYEVDTLFTDTSMMINSNTTEDSVQFLHGTEAVKWPDSAHLTGIRHGVSALIVTTGWLEILDAHQQLSIAGNLFAYGNVTINGNATAEADFSDSDYDGPFCMFDIDLASTFTNLTMNTADLYTDACPSTGVAGYAGSINMDCIGDISFTFSDWWSVTQTFDGTDIHFVFENSTTRWEHDQICSSDSVSTPGDRIRTSLK
jgi:hypothetical protein